MVTGRARAPQASTPARRRPGLSGTRPRVSSPRIRVLPDALADQIAAGEVVERPESVVKELVENAIDAGASSISIEIAAGGIAAITVVDDGHGMSREDATLAIRRHATSKIRCLEDLARIGTLGFRGEAIPSIASVSRFELTTRERDAVEGTRVRVDGGAAPAIEPIGCAPGTAVRVRELFYNVPARLKFLKSPGTESARVTEVVRAAALANPAIRFTLVRDGRRGLELLPAASRAERARLVAGGGGRLDAIEGEREGVRVEAMLGAPETARAGAGGLHLFVNGRHVRDRALSRAVAFAYGSVLPPGRYPVGVVHVAIDPAEVDVNVHPQKAEVRFARGREVLDAITRVLARGLGTSAWSGPAGRGAGFWADRLGGAPPAAPASPAPEAGPPEPDPWGLAAAAEPRPYTPAAPVGYVNDAPLLTEQGFFASLRVLGQVRKMLIVCEGRDGLHVLDQHAADERIRFDGLRRGYLAREVAIQRLLIPERVEVTEAEAVVCDERREDLLALGLDVAPIGPATVAVRGVPAVVSRAPPARLLHDVLAELTRAGDRAFGDAVDMALATMACHGAIRAGDPLSVDECRALLRALDAITDFGGHCPHGRPVVYSVSFGELTRRLGR
ncbi:MAG: DNA mismatch repair endonuclease MutL [Sandaracinaceae bacterium]|nr:DNA mismatch repair endonuclease MutL [Sandaracinaceae bacterium]